MPINKGKPPEELIAAKRRLKSTPDTSLNWEGIDKSEKRAILHSLLNEQGDLCAYCTRKISETDAHVEHLIPQSARTGCDDPDSVDYNNLLAVCDGFEGSAAGLTCDRARGDAPLTVNPLRSDSLKSIRYQRDGRIRSDHPEIEYDLNVTLNLNQEQLVSNRREAVRQLERLLKERGKRRGDQAVRSFCRHYIDQHLANPQERSSYDGVIIYFMRRRLHNTNH